MEKLSGQVIDFYDDLNGTVLKRRFPTQESLPDLIKEGTFLEDDERSRMRDGLFALVMKNGDESMRKFACTDTCNTALSIMYLLDHSKDLLPEAAVKTAAQNLVAACKTYDMATPTKLEKLAGAMPDTVSPYIDVTNMEVNNEPPSKNYCLQKEAKYPIDSYEDVLNALNYFEKNAKLFHPAKRREFSLNLASRAETLGVPVTPTVEKYASNAWADKLSIKAQIHTRMEKTASNEARTYYKFLFSKVGSVAPGVFANMLMEIDESTGASAMWDDAVADPFGAVLQKEANTFSYTTTQGQIDEEDLLHLKGYRGLLVTAFGEDFYDEFKKNPVDVFKSLPEPEKNTIQKLVAAAKKW